MVARCQDATVLVSIMSKVTISAKGEGRIASGHPWIYRSDVIQVAAERGQIVQVANRRNVPLGYAFYSDRSEIAVRMLTRDTDPPSPDLFRDRLEAAATYRASLRIDATAYRLVHGEADRFPGLVVDRYGDYLVLQALVQATDTHLADITRLLVDRLQPAGILARNDPRVRLLEGLEQRVDVLHGTVPEMIEVREGRATYAVDPYKGQKTGLFLDQRENRFAAAAYARGRALDAFSYNGGFANMVRNGLRNVRAHAMNVFDELRELERRGERFDTIVLDPPAFAKNKAAVAKALTGYKEINLRALKLLNPGGILVTCSCSYNVSEGMFADVLASAAADARADVVVVEKRMQGRDHPVLVTVPETYYLKCFVLRKL
jgi:23S rRNA (cytosine1962-C5)-methyltransferase